MRIIYRNDLSELARLAADIEAFAETNGLDLEIVHTFNLCLDEVFTNIVSYAYADDLPHEIILELQATPREVMACIRDDGRAYDPLTEAPVPDLHASIEERKIGGLGVHFVKQLMTRVAYRREGGWNVLEMARAHGPAKASAAQV
ncbi:MAG TPA: ATP-binding protein [Opitutales bacterium]|jgi:serine/threonine-protein kinase RsbW|nr:ATP-binding protein [Opitutales bacterium]